MKKGKRTKSGSPKAEQKSRRGKSAPEIRGPNFRLPLDEASYPGGGCLQCRGADPTHRVPRGKHHVLGEV